MHIIHCTTTKDKPTNSSINNQSIKDNKYDDETDDDADDDEIFNNKNQSKVLIIINLFIYKIGRGGGDRGTGSNKEYSVKNRIQKRSKIIKMHQDI